MADIKQASFMFLIILVSISAMYEWAENDPVFKDKIGVSGIEGYESSVVLATLKAFEIAADNLVTTTEQTDLLGLIPALIDIFGAAFNAFMKLAFGWEILISSIFTNIGMQDIALIFTTPIAVFQMLGVFYILRDLVNTVRGVK